MIDNAGQYLILEVIILLVGLALREIKESQL